MSQRSRDLTKNVRFSCFCLARPHGLGARAADTAVALSDCAAHPSRINFAQCHCNPLVL